jgi:uncharacterized iron-regulated protein
VNRLATTPAYLLSRLITAMAFVAACAPAAPPAGVTPEPAPAAIVETTTGSVLPVAQVAQELEEADVVFFGELHGDTAVHRIEVELLQALADLGRPVVVSLEMFERDVQDTVDAYLAGRIDEQRFRAGARPWPRYATDYRPIVELAKTRGWPVVAANVPRSIASAVSRRGVAALDSLEAGSRAHAAAEIVCGDDAYRARFLEQIRSHPGPGGASDTLATSVAERFYLAQCVKDESMAESIVNAIAAAPDAIIVHYTGSFHSDYGFGTVERVLRRAPALRTQIVSSVGIRAATAMSDAERGARADYILVVPGR